MKNVSDYFHVIQLKSQKSTTRTQQALNYPRYFFSDQIECVQRWSWRSLGNILKEPRGIYWPLVQKDQSIGQLPMEHYGTSS